MASIALVGAYFYCINYHGESEKVIINVKEGQTYSTLSSLLKEKDLIKSELAYKIYIKLTIVSVILSVSSSSFASLLNVAGT